MAGPSDSDIKRFSELGLWSDDPHTHSLSGLLQRNAQSSASKLAICDDPDRKKFDGLDAKQLTWEELNRRVNSLAAFFLMLGLPEKSVIAYKLPATTDAFTTFVAIQRAGMVAAPIPMFWRSSEIKTALTAVQARVIIAAEHTEGEQSAFRCRDIAASVFSIRYVFGFGASLPDGVVSLEPIIDAGLESSSQAEFPVQNPNQVNTLQFIGAASDVDNIIPRTSNQWFSAVRDYSEEKGTEILSSLGATSLTDIAVGFVRVLLAEGTLALHHFKTVSRLSDCCKKWPSAELCLPTDLEKELSARRRKQYQTLLQEQKKLNLVAKSLNVPAHPRGREAKLTFSLEGRALFVTEIAGETSVADVLSQERSIETSGLSLNIHSEDADMKSASILVDGAGVVKDFWPTNDEALARNRLKRVQGEALKLEISLHVKEDANVLEDVSGLSISAQRHSENYLQQVYSSSPLIADATLFERHHDGQISRIAAVVAKPGMIVEAEELNDHLRGSGYGVHLLVDEVLSVNGIPRSLDGKVNRPALLRVYEEDRKSDKIKQKDPAQGVQQIDLEAAVSSLASMVATG